MRTETIIFLSRSNSIFTKSNMCETSDLIGLFAQEFDILILQNFIIPHHSNHVVCFSKKNVCTLKIKTPFKFQTF